jgi:hypothetical protein
VVDHFIETAYGVFYLWSQKPQRMYGGKLGDEIRGIEKQTGVWF